ncbi:hypothetical protein [Streptomyces sp. NPDC005953]|uniref:hypothetical protein n=1 Tax=unclassified Streptomyces TaxID=2593676 RepID=UPI0033F2ECA6
MAQRLRSSRRRSTMSALVLLPVALIVGCQQPAEGTSRAKGQSGNVTTAPDYGTVFLGPGDCGSRDKHFLEVPCTSEKAAARVIARHGGRQSTGPACPLVTDYVLHISHGYSPVDEDGDGDVGQGYACMRNLEPPHPGDPGGGGGPHTVVGDCVYRAGGGQVKETACNGAGRHPPGYRIESAVLHRSQCPDTTDLYVQLRVGKPVGCAHHI